MSRTTDVDFERPPVQEVVCGVVFRPLDRLKTAHIGIIWSAFGEEFPQTDDVLPLAYQTPEGPRIDPRPRVWFVSEDNQRIIQVQSDRFLFNWRRIKADDPYPRFESVYAAFLRHYASLKRLLSPSAELVPEQFELAYVNVLPLSPGGAGALNGLFPDLARDVSRRRYLPPPEQFHWTGTYTVPGAPAPLRVTISPLPADADGSTAPTVRLELMVRGPPDPTRADFDSWFDSAHEVVVHGFLDLTSAEVQLSEWKRRSTQ